jgi:hypothetical protein
VGGHGGEPRIGVVVGAHGFFEHGGEDGAAPTGVLAGGSYGATGGSPRAADRSKAASRCACRRTPARSLRWRGAIGGQGFRQSVP